MRILLTGATGFIGRALIPLLQRDGHAVVAWVRSQGRARSQLGAEVELVPADAGFDVLVRAIERCDAVVNLAGEPLMGGRWTAARRAILEDSRVRVTDLYRVRIGPLPVRWRTRIAKWDHGRGFVDVQEAGPYRLWWHEHSFHADGARTVMEDRVFYTPPLGILGRLANRLFIAATLRKMFRYRGDVIRLRFGVS